MKLDSTARAAHRTRKGSLMFTELAAFDVKADRESDFEEAFAQSTAIFSVAHGCLGATLSRAVEQPGRYVIHVRWSSLDDHTIRFKEDGHLDRWRALVGQHLSGPPSMLHYVKVGEVAGSTA